jgi:hypothetical protein
LTYIKQTFWACGAVIVARQISVALNKARHRHGETRRFLGHTTEHQTTEYVRDKISELVNPLQRQNRRGWRKYFRQKAQSRVRRVNAKALKDLEAEVGIEPA